MIANSAPAGTLALSDHELIARLTPDMLPRHVAIIMDGNGRWARARGLPRIAGHSEGIKSLQEVIALFLELGIPALTIYAFSQENWNRPAGEIKALMGLLEHYLSTEQSRLVERGIRLRTIGRVEMLPAGPLARLRASEEQSMHCDKLVLTVGLSYGGRSEIVDAVRKIATDCKVGSLQTDEIDEGLFERYLSTTGLPDPDLLIRTSGESRISNFLLWQLAYCELYFTDVLWPDFDAAALRTAIADFAGRERRYGKTSAQVQSQATQEPGA